MEGMFQDTCPFLLTFRNNWHVRLQRRLARSDNFPFRKRSLPFGTVVALSNISLLNCSFHEEDKVLISEIQLILTLTRTL